jgi:thiamine biosynthesis lipoprotein
MKDKIRFASLLTVTVLFLIASCGRNGGVFEEKINVLGTFAQISIVGMPQQRAREAAAVVEQYLQALDNIGYTFAAEGELQQLNAALAEGRSMMVSSVLLEVIEDAVKLSSLNNGLFNPAAGELTALWEFVCDQDECDEYPYPSEVQRLLVEQVQEIIARQPSMDDLIINGNEVSSRNPQVKLQFGDMIRGFALNKGIELLEKAGVSNAMINIGGSVRTIGTRGDHDWWIGITDGSGKHVIGSIENIDDLSVVTVRSFDKSSGKHGPVYRHVVDPRTGMPVRDVQSVVVMHEDAMIANAAAVTMLIAGIEDWKTMADGMGAHKILLITKDGTIYTSPAMEHIIHWKQGIDHQHLVP